MNLHLKEMRRLKGYKQKELADILGIDWRTYGSWERGERGLTLENAYNCAIALGCTIDELAGMPERAPSFSEARKNALIGYYDSMNEKGRDLLVQSAKHMSADPEVRIVKDSTERVDDQTAMGA